MDDAATCRVSGEMQATGLDIVARALGCVVSSKQVMDTVAHW